MKKALTVLLLALLLFQLAACSRSQTASTTPPSENSSQDASSAAPLPSAQTGQQEQPQARPETWLTDEKVTLRYVLSEGSNSSVTANPTNDLPVMQMYEELTNVHIEWETIPASNYNEVITARLSAAIDLPDLVTVPAGQVARLGQEGVIISLQPLIDEYGPRISEYDQDNRLYYISQLSPDGNRYVVAGSVLKNVYNVGLMINKFWLEAVGLSMPTTIDEFYDMLVAFRDGDPNGNGEPDEIPYTAKPDNLAELACSYGLMLHNGSGYSLDENGTVQYDYMSPRYKEFLTLANRMYTEGLLNKEYTSASNQDEFELIANDRLGSVSFWHSWAASYSALHKNGDPEGETPVFIPSEPLIGPYGDQMKVERIGANPQGGFGVTQVCKTPEIAVAWIDYIMFSKECQDLYIYGIEGLTYTLVDGEIERIIPQDKSWEELLIEIGGRQPAHPHIQTPEGRRTMFPDWVYGYVDMLYPYYVSPVEGLYMPLTSEEKLVWDQHNADITTYVGECMAKFINGSMSLDSFDSYVKQLEDMGIGQLLEIVRARQARYEQIEWE